MYRHDRQWSEGTRHIEEEDCILLQFLFDIIIDKIKKLTNMIYTYSYMIGFNIQTKKWFVCYLRVK